MTENEVFSVVNDQGEVRYQTNRREEADVVLRANIEQARHRLEGEELSVGEQLPGMRKSYGEIVPQIWKKLMKQYGYGGELEPISFDSALSKDFPDASAVVKGDDGLYRFKMGENGSRGFASEAEAQEAASWWNKDVAATRGRLAKSDPTLGRIPNTQNLSLPITPELRERVKSQGLRLYAGGAGALAGGAAGAAAPAEDEQARRRNILLGAVAGLGGEVGLGMAAARPPSGRRIKLTHYGEGANKEFIDPAFHGTGIRGAEARRKAAYPEEYEPRSYWYAGEHKKEVGLPASKFEFDLDETELAQPAQLQGYADKAMKELSAEGKYLNDNTVLSRMERLIKRDGYRGLVDQRGVAIIFDKVPTGRENSVDAAIEAGHAAYGGSTFNPRSEKDLGGTPNWAVATKTQKLFDAPITRADVKAWRAENAEALKDPNMMVGSWHDKEGKAHGKHELNLTRVYPEKPRAVNEAALGGEASIMNLEDFSEYDPTPAERGRARQGAGIKPVVARDLPPGADAALRLLGTNKTGAPPARQSPMQALAQLGVPPDLLIRASRAGPKRVPKR